MVMIYEKILAYTYTEDAQTDVNGDGLQGSDKGLNDVLLKEKLRLDYRATSDIAHVLKWMKCGKH